ncbi:hypothetical protein G6F70_006901 [Rhizopus microsporus]|uniref:Cyclase n=2 Tax=Rhizopus TaxID=4842 RepID=A0A367JYZ2_RHIAZ|nr:hypothetical protein G6F71_000606 [Rhizopus microsporus]RCH95153.1 hypothetical protein CU097_004318 [Rhizopus azygosporus]KAG1197098.1 hypothetical protein G6F70_006901 [Rhizopus microsporus]KAG1211390.1 hypothetical protein G6F69_004624 [Rhizopus microsporus]KAG1230320.1 hypothetical protein G6F67_006536 [Rhizopus microsporus]
MANNKLPSYDELPIDSKYPDHTAWGLWGDDDNLGTLNLLTEERIANAAKHIRRGAIFPLNWKLESPSPALFGRDGFEHNLKPLMEGALAFDDVYQNFNTQASTQWDGLCHVCHIGTGCFYNGVKPSDILNKCGRLGIHHMARRGIAGRAVLLDYGRWAEVNKPDFNPLKYTEIPVEELDQVAAAQGVTFEIGDILLLRTGWIAAYEKHGEKIKEHILDPHQPECAGVKACQDTYRWIWDHHFAAVASDCFPFEAFPPKDWSDSCHSAFLGGFGMPIGEMFYLEKLAEDSAKDNVYTYFFTSAPLNKEHGVASPPNAICIK